MNISATIAKMNAIRAVLTCAVFCAAVLCPAQETARGIVAEKIETEKNSAERAEPELRFQLGHSDSVYSVAWSPDGKYIASGSGDKSIKIWDAATGKELRTLEGHLKDVYSVAWSPDGKHIASGSDDHTAKIWDAASGKEVRTLDHSSHVNSVAWSPDGKYIASGSWDGSVKIWDAASGKELRALSGHYNDVTAVAWSPDGKHIASGGGYSDRTMKIWDAESGKELCVLKHSDDVRFVAWSPDGKHIASGGGDSVKIWDAASGKEIRSFSGRDISSRSIAWSPNGKDIVVGKWNGEIIILNIANESKIRFFSEDSKNVKSVAWSPNGKYIVSGTNYKSTTKVYDGASLNKIVSFKQIEDSAICWSPDSKYIAGNSYDYNVEIWDGASGEKLRTLSRHSGRVCSVAWSLDGKYIASGSWDKTVKIWDATKWKEVRTLIGHSSSVSSAAWSPDGKCIASGSFDNTIKIWDAASGKELRTLSGHSGSVRSVAWSPDGKCIASAVNSTVKIWEAENGKELWTLTGHSDGVISVAWSPDGKYIASGGYDHMIKIWDAQTGKELRTLSGHFNEVKSVTWSPDGRYIASGSEDGTIKIWDAQNGTLLSTTINGKDDEWLTYTPEGFFCGSEWATQNLVYIVDGMDVIGIDQVYDTYYRPDLVAAKMRGEDISAYASSVRLASLVRSGRAPAVSLSGIPAESSGRDMTFDISVQNTGGGIGAVNLLLNGKAIRLSDGVTAADGETISFRHTVTLQNGSNTLEAFALNGAGLVESVRSSAQVVWRGATEKPDLYVLTAAVNRYRDKSLWLKYAVPDAQSVAAGFQKQKSGLYRNVHVSQLNDGDVTKEKLAAEFSRLSEHIRADDVFVFFVSGHGTTYDDGDYYYLPSDFRYTSKDSIPNGGISKNDLLANLSKIKAGKTLVMLDTCNSGAFLSDSNKRGLSEKTAIDRLTRATGHATLAASSDTQSAMEGYNGHGVFTYVFLEGIAGAADSDGDGYVTLNELSTFVEREVPERSYEKWGYEQVPQKDLRRQDFPIAGK
ncbi:MAG: caspase family protein [Treponemataceae bacterium]|nr:caspase family protein [Treponemataceae bacterium]